MPLTNNLRKQVDVPVWEWCRFSPAVSSGLSATCSADNSLYHVTFGRYIYYLQSTATLATTTGLTGFFRYDTVSDSYQALSQPPVTNIVYTGMQFAGGQGYNGFVLGNGGGLNTLQVAGLTGQTLKGFDIRIIGGTGTGQQRVVTKVADPVIWDNGTATAVAATPQANLTDSNKNWAINQWVGYQVRFVSSVGTSQLRKIVYNNSNTLYWGDVAKFAEDPWAWSPVTTIAGSAEVIASATAGSQTMYQIESCVLTVDSNWATVPDSTSRFLVRGGGIWMISQGATYALQFYDVLADQWYIRNAGAATSPVTAIGTDGTIVNTGENATVWDRGVATGTQSTTTLQDTSKNWTTNQWAGYNVRIFSGTGENQYRSITSNTSNTLTVPAWTTITPDTTTRYFIEAFDMSTLTSAGANTQTGSSTGTINGSVFTAGATTGKYYPGQVLSGTGIQSTTTILSAPAECYTTGTTNVVNFAVSNPSSLGIVVGMVASVNSIAGLPGQAGSGALALAATGPSYVTAVSSTTVTLSTNVSTALVNTTLQFATAWASTNASHTASGSYITLASGNTTGLFPGMYLSIGGGLTGTLVVGTYVAQVIDSTHFTISQAPTVTLGGTGWLFAQSYQTVIVNQLTGLPGGAGTYTVFPSQTVASTTIVGTGVATVTDTAKSWPAGRWNNYAIRIKAGTGNGQVRQILGTVSNGTVAYTSASGATNVGAVITVTSTTNLAVNQLLNVTSGTGAFAYGTFVQSITNSTTFVASAAPTINLASSAVVTGTPINTLIVYPYWTTPPDNTSVYVIHGDTDKNYFSTAAQTPTFIHNIDADTVTTGRQLDRGVARGVSAQYSDYEPIAVSSGVPVYQVTSGTGSGATVATTAGSVASNIATVTYSTAAASAVFPIGSWVTVAGTTSSGGAYNGTWQVVNSSVGSVSFYTLSTTGTITVQGTIAQAASFNLAIGTLASGNWAQFANGTTITGVGNVPATFNGALTVAAGVAAGTALTFGGYQSASGATSSGSTITVGNTVGLTVGAMPTVTAGTGTFAAGTIVTSITNTTTFVVNNAPSVALSSGAVVTVVPSVAVTAASPGNLVTLGVIQKNPVAPSGITGSAGTVTVATTGIGFPVGSWIVITGAVPGTYNGIFQVTGGTPGTNVQYANATTTTATTVGLVGVATQTMLVTTVNNNNFQTGMTISHKGDQGFTPSVNNISATITVMTPAVGTPATQYIYSTSSPSAQMFVFGQTTGVLCDGSKSWIVNQWAGCQVTYNSTQITGVAVPIQPTILTAYIIANTANTLIFAAVHTTAPGQGVSRYVITAPATFGIGNTVGSIDSGLVQGAQLITQLQDVTKSWIMPAPITGITATTISNGVNTCVVTGSMNGILVGMTVVVTLGNTTLAAGTVINSISSTTLTLSNNFVGAGTTATLTFAATASSSGTTVTVTGYPLVNLAPGMKLAMTATTNMSSSVITTGAFVLNGGVNFTPVTVVSITSATTFTISQTPTVPLQNATVQATFWVPGQWVNRRIRITSGITINNVEAIVTANTTSTLTFLTIGTAPVHGTNGYAIMQQPLLRGLGTALFWNFGASNTNTIGKYLYQARGGNVPGFDRLNLTTDKWDFLMATPSFEPLNTGAMYAYDGVDRIYFTVQVTQRVYYLDIENNVIHPAGMYPYLAGTATIGNRMEIFQTTDGLKYMWLNRHANVECFRQLLFY